MSEPLTTRQRRALMGLAEYRAGDPTWGDLVRYEATVRREEERALVAEARVRALDEALSEALAAARSG